jgi:hypothetical protein
MMKKNVWKKILPALIAATALAGSSAVAQTVTVPVPSDSFTTPGKYTIDGNDITTLSIIGVDDTTTALTFTGGAGATLNYTGVEANDGYVFAFYDIGNTTNLTDLTEINFDHLTLTGGKRVGNSGRMDAGGGAYLLGFRGGQTVNLDYVTVTDNYVAATTSDSSGAGGGGLNINNNDAEDDVYAYLNNVVITNNKAEGKLNNEQNVWGGGLSVTAFHEIIISDSVISGNVAVNTNSEGGDDLKNAAGGGIAIWNQITGTNVISVVEIYNSTISGNIVESKVGGAAGGGIWTEEGEINFDLAIIDTDFTKNEAIGGAGSNGGAISTDADYLYIGAYEKDVLFSGNKVSEDFGVTKTSQSIYSNNPDGYVVFFAENGRTITDEDGFVVKGTVAVGGEGKLKLGASNGDDRLYLANTVGVGEGGTLELGDGASLYAYRVGADYGVGTINVASGAYLGTMELGVLDSGATSDNPNVLNTNGDIDAYEVSGEAYTILNIQSGTIRTGSITSDGTVNIASGARLFIEDTGSTVENLSGDGYIFFNPTDDDYLLTVNGENNFTGTATAVDSLGFGVRYNDEYQIYYGYEDGIAHIADGYLAVASIHNFNAGYQAVQDHLISGRARRLGFLGQSECDPCEPAGCNPCDPCGALVGSGTRSAWVNYVGRNNQYQSSYNGREFWNTTSNGVQVGVDLYRTYKNQLGLLFGYEKSDSDMRTNSIDADDVYFGFYAAHVFSNGADARIVANFGWQEYDSIRTDYFNWRRYDASFDGRTTELNLELGKRIYRTSSFSFRPVAAIDLYINDVDGAQESDVYNNGTAVKYNGLSYTQAFLRLGSDFKIEKKRVTLNGGVYYAYDLNDNKLKSTVDVGVNNYNIYGSDLGRQVVTFNVGGSFKVSNSLDVFGGFTGNAYVDRDGTPFQSVGYVGGAVRW